jgi:hypothetical protein
MLGSGFAGAGSGAIHRRTNVLVRSTKHSGGTLRQSAVDPDLRSLAVSMTRTAAMLLLAALLILVILPAALGAERDLIHV